MAHRQSRRTHFTLPGMVSDTPSSPGTAGAASAPLADASAETGGATPHYETSVERDLLRIKRSLTRMSELAGRALREGLRALRERDRQLAYAVMIRDQAIDGLEEETARSCLEFLVRQQPVASLLRFAYSAIRVNMQLERVGDYAEAIAHQAAKLATRGAELPMERFHEIAGLALPMLEDAVRAFVEQDAELARATMPVEDTVDLLKSRLRKDLMQMHKDGHLPFEALDPCLTITRRLERVSDQARNICAETLYLCTGEFAQHPDTNTFRILFLDQHNAGASLMAESLAASLGGPRCQFDSAGLDPRPAPPALVEFMRGRGFDLTRRSAKALSEVPGLDRFHIVAVLHPDAKKGFPRQTRKIVFLDWPVEDPATVGDSPEATRAACERAYQALDQHLRALLPAILDQTPG